MSSIPVINFKARMLEEELLCVRCQHPPITKGSFQCQNGHLICGPCSPLTPTCPSCQGPNLKVRCHVALEKFMDQIPFACRYRQNGCQEPRLLRDELTEHMNTCDFRPELLPGDEIIDIRSGDEYEDDMDDESETDVDSSDSTEDGEDSSSSEEERENGKSPDDGGATAAVKNESAEKEEESVKTICMPPPKRMRRMEGSPQKSDSEVIFALDESKASVELDSFKGLPSPVPMSSVGRDSEDGVAESKKDPNGKKKVSLKRDKKPCPFCGKVFFNDYNALRHATAYHHDSNGGKSNKTEWICPFPDCKSVRTGAGDLGTHLYKNHRQNL